MTIFMIVFVFVAVAAAFFAIGAALMAPSSVVGVRLQTMLGYRPEPESPKTSERLERVLEPFAKALPQSPESLSDTRLLLFQAGYREARHVSIYLGVRVLAALLAFGVIAVTGMLARSPLLALAGPALGFMLPRFMLKRRVARRQESIRLALPDALDLAIICVEAGLGLDQALDRIAVEIKSAHPELSDEMELVTLEIRAGKPREEALRNLSIRTGVDDIRAFVAVLIQTDRFGTSIATALRVHSDALRTERRQRAEERAAKTTIKMIPVLVLFIFPVMFFVILGPVVIQVTREVLPAMGHK